MKSVRRKSVIIAVMLCFIVGAAVPAFAEETGSQPDAVVGSVVGEHLSELAGEIINNVTEMSLEDINEETGGFLSESLVSLLGGSTGRALEEIAEEIEKTQDMILEVQASLDALAYETRQSFNEIKTEQYKQDLERRTLILDGYKSTLDNLTTKYSNITSDILDENEDKNNDDKIVISEEDWEDVVDFIEDVDDANIPGILNGIKGMTNPTLSDPLYETQLTYLRSDTSFYHKTYMNMYYMANYVAQLRSNAFTLLKEQMAYEQMEEYAQKAGYSSAYECYSQGGFKDFTVDYDDYINDYYNPTIHSITEEFEENQVFKDMAEVFKSAKDIPELPDESSYSTADQWKAAINQYMNDYIDALEKAVYNSTLTEIEVYDPDGNRVTEDAYKVVCNKDNKTYYISLAEHTLREYVHHSEWERWNGLYNIDCNEYSMDYGAGISSDGRYLLPTSAEDIDDLMSSTNSNQLSYLITELRNKENNCQLPSDRKIILTTKTEEDEWDNTDFWDNLYLLDSGNYSTTAGGSQYMETEDGLVNAEDIYYPAQYKFAGDDFYTVIKDAKLLMIYKEQGMANLTPATKSDLPAGFNLNDGQTLDLSELNDGEILEKKITVTGNVTIEGGGKTFTGLQIYLCEDAHLTLRDIDITSDNNIIKAYGRDVSLTASGKVSLTATTTKTPIYGYEQCEQLSIYTQKNAAGDEEFNVTGTALKEGGGAAICVNNKLIIEDAEIHINSSVERAIKAGKNSRISGTFLICNTALSGNEEITLGSGSVIENSVLNLTWGGVSEGVTLTNNEWTGKARIKVEIKTGSIPNADTDERVDMTLYNGSKSVKLDDISKIDGDQFEKGNTDTFYFSVEHEFTDNDAMTLRMYDDDGWFVEYAKVYDLSGSGKVNTYNFYCWLDNDGSWTAHKGEVVSTLVVKTADENLAGTASNIKVAVKYIDNSGNTKTTEAKNITKYISNGQFDAGDADAITLVYPELREDDVKEILGFYVTSDHSGSNAGWKLESMEFYLNKSSSTAPKMIATGLDQWFLEANKTCYFGKTWSESGSCTITTKTANKSNAGTDSYVYLSIVNQDGVETEGFNFTLYCQKRDYDPMEKGKTDKFNIAYDEAIGDGISKIIVNSTGSGAGPTWECEYIEIVLRGNDGSTSQTYRFSVNKKIGKGIYEFTPDGVNTVSLTPRNHYSVDELKAMLAEAKDSLHVTAKEPAILSQEILTYLKKTGKSLTLEHCDEDGNVLYQWIFRGEDMGEISSDIDLGINFVTEGFKDLYREDPAKPAVALQFNHKGAFPAGTSIRFNGETYGFEAGADAYPYIFDSAASKLILSEEDVFVNDDGTISLLVTDGSDILVTGTKLADGEGVDTSVATGDQIPVFVWISLLICAIAACTAVVVLRRSRKQ